RSDVRPAGAPHRHRRDRLAARARQPHHRARELRRHHQPPVEVAAGGIAQDHRSQGPGMITRVALFRVLVIAAAVLLLELLCLAGVIDRITMPPPHIIVRDLGKLLLSGALNAAIAKTLTNASVALALALVAGVAGAVAIHRYKALRETLDPLF